MAAPAWTEVLVLVPEGWQELVAGVLARGPCTSVAFGKPSLGTDDPPAGFEYLRSYVIEDDDGPQLRAEVSERLASLAVLTGAQELAGLEARFRRLPPEDWASSWRKVWKPMRVGRFAIVPPDWSGQLRPADLRLVLEPGGAFGTGRHATTRGCLRALGELSLEGARVLDAGCGSGILAVAACLAGARSALAFDIDPNAIPYARELARSNAVGERCEARVGGFDLLATRERSFDVVLANIYADVVVAHADDLARSLAAGGTLIVSGCTVDRRPEVRGALEGAGLRVGEPRLRGRWDTWVGAPAGVSILPGPAGDAPGSPGIP